MYNKSIKRRDNETIEKIKNIFIEALRKGLNNKDWKQVISRLSILEPNSIQFMIYFSSSKQNQSNYYFSIIENEIFFSKIRNKLKLIFSTTKKRRQLKDEKWLDREEKIQLLNIIENGFDKGLTNRKQDYILELGKLTSFVYFEFNCNDSSKVPILNINYT